MSRNVRQRTFGHVRPTKIRINLRVLAVLSESSPGSFWIAKNAKFLYADNKNSDQTARIRRLLWVFVGRTCPKLRFPTLRLRIWGTNKKEQHRYFAWTVQIISRKYLGTNSNVARVKPPYASKIDILLSKKGLINWYMVHCINTVIKCGIWQPVKFQLVSRSWIGSKMKWFFIVSLNYCWHQIRHILIFSSYLWINDANIMFVFFFSFCFFCLFVSLSYPVD